jgi:hypothetical protein
MKGFNAKEGEAPEVNNVPALVLEGAEVNRLFIHS